MAESPNKQNNVKTKPNEYVALVCVDSVEEAQEYEIALQNDGIPVVVNEDVEPSMGASKVAVMVPEEYVDEAHVIIEAQDAYDDFYNFEDDDEDDDPDMDYFLNEEEY